jgi:thiamine-monophosphate kinase
MAVDDFGDFFRGIADACRLLGVHSAGGNIRTAPRFECHGTAFGLVSKHHVLSRDGCRPGDRLAVVGRTGGFICAYLKAKVSGLAALTSGERASLLRPVPKVREMLLLAGRGVLSAASDNSDGVLGSLLNIAERSGCAVDVDVDALAISRNLRRRAAEARVDPLNLLFFWGDWQVVVGVRRKRADDFVRLAARHNIPYMWLGRARDDSPALYGITRGDRHRMNVLRNENFRENAYNTSAEANVDHMLHAPLFAEKLD